MPVVYRDTTLPENQQEDYYVLSTGSQPMGEFLTIVGLYNMPWFFEGFTDPENTAIDARHCYGVFVEAQPWLTGDILLNGCEHYDTPLSVLYGIIAFHVKIGSGYYYYGMDLQIDTPSYYEGIYLYSTRRYAFGMTSKAV